MDKNDAKKWIVMILGLALGIAFVLLYTPFLAGLSRLFEQLIRTIGGN